MRLTGSWQAGASREGWLRGHRASDLVRVPVRCTVTRLQHLHSTEAGGGASVRLCASWLGIHVNGDMRPLLGRCTNIEPAFAPSRLQHERLARAGEAALGKQLYHVALLCMTCSRWPLTDPAATVVSRAAVGRVYSEGCAAVIGEDYAADRRWRLQRKLQTR